MVSYFGPKARNLFSSRPSGSQLHCLEGRHANHNTPALLERTLTRKRFLHCSDDLFYSHALFVLSADDSGRFLQNPREVAQIVGGRAGESKDQTLEKIRTLHSSELYRSFMNRRRLTAPQADPLEGGRGVFAQKFCHCISWEKATTIKMRLSRMLFFSVL